MNRLHDLPLAIQSVERMAGSVVPLGATVWPVIGADTLHARLVAAQPNYQSGVIFQGLTAAWIWGARRESPIRLEYAVHHKHRVQISSRDPFVRREMTFLTEDISQIQGRMITSPLRTIFDLLQLPEPVFNHERVTLRLLFLIGSVSRAQVLGRLKMSPRTPHSREMRKRLAEL